MEVQEAYTARWNLARPRLLDSVLCRCSSLEPENCRVAGTQSQVLFTYAIHALSYRPRRTSELLTLSNVTRRDGYRTGIGPVGRLSYCTGRRWQGENAEGYRGLGGDAREGDARW